MYKYQPHINPIDSLLSKIDNPTHVCQPYPSYQLSKPPRSFHPGANLTHPQAAPKARRAEALGDEATKELGSSHGKKRI